MARFAIFIFLMLASARALAQVDTSFVLETVSVMASRFRHTPVGYQSITLDSNRLQQIPSLSIADLLQQNTGIFIKSYGLGSLATSSIRGASAQHTAVVWNGFPIQSPMLGQLDLALLPASFLDEVQVQYGGNGALWGSGAVGGVLQLNNKLPYNQGWQFRWNSQIGSFSQWHQDVKINFSNKKIAHSTRILYQSAKNDFPYRVTSNASAQRQQNAGFQQVAILQDNRVQLNPNQSLSFRIWVSQAEQKIPPTTTQNFSIAKQDNGFLRATVDWQFTKNQWIAQIRMGVFYDDIHYRDSIAGINSPSHSWTSISEAEAQWNLNAQHRLHIGINHTFAKGEADGYPEGQGQRQSALFAAYRWQVSTWRSQLSLRQGFANHDLIPSFGLEHDITKWILIKANITKNFRLPTLNDLYWQPGGNPSLQPENGWAEELTAQTHWKSKYWRFSYSIIGFNRNVDNWILWIPGNTFWSPQNISQVWSRGIEQRLNWKLETRNWKLELSGGYDWIRSTQERAANEVNVNKQLIYVPIHQAFGRLSFIWQALQISYQHQYTGSVFTRSDNLASLPDYQLGFLNGRYGREFSSFKGSLFLQINNLWNIEYRVIERRRMPGQNFQLGVTLDFHP